MENESLEIENTNLCESVFSGTSLKDIDFTTSSIYGIEVRIPDIAGGIFSMEQAIELSKLMKIVIK